MKVSDKPGAVHWAILRDDRGWNGPASPGVVFHYHPGRKGEYADEILMGFDGTIQVDAYGGYSHLAKPERKGGKPLKLAFCWAHGRRKLIAAKPKKGSPIVDEALLRIAALYKVEDTIRGSDPDQRRQARQTLSLPLTDAFFIWLSAQSKRISRKSDLGEAMAYMLRRQDGFRRFGGLRGPTGATVPLTSLTMAVSTSTQTWSRTQSAARP